MDFFELQYEEQSVLQGEELFDKQAVEDVLQVDKRLWIALVRDNSEVHEIEILRPKTKNRECTCDCDQYALTSNCPHILAALFALRNKLTSTPKTKKKNRKTGKTLNVNAVLDQIDAEHLAQFIRAYAKKDKKFSTLLKAHFARKIAVESEGKYKAIMQSVIKPIQTAEVKISASQVKHFVDVCGELVDQLEDALVLEDFVEAVQIWSACTSMTSYVQHYTPLQSKEVQKLQFRLGMILKQLIHLDLSPDLYSNLVNKVYSVAQLSYYNYMSISYNVLEMLFSGGQVGQSIQEEIVDLITELLSSKDQDQIIILSALKSRALFNLGIDENFEEIIKTFGQDTSVYVRAILKANDFNCASHVCSEILKIQPDFQSINKALIEVYQHQNNTEGVRLLAFETFVAKHEMRYFDMLKNATPPKLWLKIRTNLLSQIKKVRVRTEVLKRDEDWLALIEELKQENDIRLSMQYTYRLNLNVAKDLADLYEGQVRTFLSTHLGSHAGVFFNEIMMHLESVGALKSIKRIHKLLDQEFSHRTVSVARF